MKERYCQLCGNPRAPRTQKAGPPEHPTELLVRARDYLTEHGWTTGHYTNEDGAVCPLGALRAVTPQCPCASTQAFYSNAVHALERSGVARWGVADFVPASQVHHMNDYVATDLHDVIGWFNDAIHHSRKHQHG